MWMLSKLQGLVWGKLLVEVFRVRGGVVHGEADTDVLVRVLILRCPHIYRLAWWPVVRKWPAILHVSRILCLTQSHCGRIGQRRYAVSIAVGYVWPRNGPHIADHQRDGGRVEPQNRITWRGAAI